LFARASDDCHYHSFDFGYLCSMADGFVALAGRPLKLLAAREGAR
jgi:hypothetical protein